MTLGAQRRDLAASTRSPAIAIVLAHDAVDRRGDQGYDALGSIEDEARFRWSLRLAEAAAASNAMSHDDAFREHAVRMNELAQHTEGLVKIGRRSSTDLDAARYFAADAELRRAQTRAK